jgi:iron transport multicopper oxidase
MSTIPLVPNLCQVCVTTKISLDVIALCSNILQSIDSGLINNNANTTFNFVPGKTYRLRLINMSALAMFFFSIDNHTMDVIEVEGIDTQRETVSNIFLAAAQRYSVLVTAKNDTSFNYMMHADMNPDMFDTVPDDLQLSE